MSLVDRFLNLFPRHQAAQRRILSLQAEIEAAGDARIRLEDEIRAKELEIAGAIREAADARRETIETHRKYADYLAFNLNRRPVFEPYSGPAAATEAPVPITSGRIYAADVVREMTRKSMESDTARQAATRELLAEQEAKARARAKAEAEKVS